MTFYGMLKLTVPFPKMVAKGVFREGGGGHRFGTDENYVGGDDIIPDTPQNEYNRRAQNEKRTTK